MELDFPVTTLGCKLAKDELLSSPEIGGLIMAWRAYKQSIRCDSWVYFAKISMTMC